jgi:predicted chitinase
MTDRSPFFSAIKSSLFRKFSQAQVDNLEAILDAWGKIMPHAPIEWIAYSLATAYHETASTMVPLREYGRGKGHKYGDPAGPFGLIYYGRGYLQLTWLANYQKATTELRKLGILKPTEDLVRNPELALRPDIAAAVMIYGMINGWFTGKSLRNFFRDGVNDPVGARKIINGQDKATLIAGYHIKFRKALQAIAPTGFITPPAPVAPPAPEPVKNIPVEEWVPVVLQMTGRLRSLATTLSMLLKIAGKS